MATILGSLKKTLDWITVVLAFTISFKDFEDLRKFRVCQHNVIPVVRSIAFLFFALILMTTNIIYSRVSVNSDDDYNYHTFKTDNESNLIGYMVL